MLFVVASATARGFAEASHALADLPFAEVRQGSILEVDPGADALVMHYTLASDRYGGRPVPGTAQVLANRTGDGLPPVVLATPPLEAGAGLGPDVTAETERHAERMVGLALDAWLASDLRPASADDALCLIHLEGAGLDFGETGALLRGLGRALAAHAPTAFS
ncbi:hypothetical protein [Symbioplanes lichenis]|uniref:hypothetical protein n=1 Tax=Symbioplanes lichenis TaxID=1629072 RepID=UPI00273922B9|nr:hypothetical protein [Actinoplanes lichenis]